MTPSVCFLITRGVRWGTEKLLVRVVELLKILNHGNERFPEKLMVILFERDRSGLTALHHAVRSGSKVKVRWCMHHGAVACPNHYVWADADDCADLHDHNETPYRSFNVKSLIPDGASAMTRATLWE